MTGTPGRIGFMQGRLSPMVDGKIQAFPWAHWTDEFAAASALRLPLMEWTLDHERLYDNPLMTAAGRAQIARLGSQHGVTVGSLTGDVFMQAPFWKTDGKERAQLLAEFDDILAACGAVGMDIVVVPLVDNGRLENESQRQVLLAELIARETTLRELGLRIVFESDFPPAGLAELIARFPAPTFGINYDTGNSAALGYDPGLEVPAYADRIVNVHIKDRVLGGTTVPLGAGAAKLPQTVKLIEASGYAGRYILQTARAADGDHAGALARYRDMLVGWIEAAHGP